MNYAGDSPHMPTPDQVKQHFNSHWWRRGVLYGRWKSQTVRNTESSFGARHKVECRVQRPRLRPRTLWKLSLGQSQDLKQGVLSHRCRHSVSFWSHCSSDASLLITKRSNVALEDHKETVCSYLNEYRLAERLVQERLQMVFMGYIITSCWMKLYQRMKHWLTRGLIKNLAQVTENDITGCFHQVTEPCYDNNNRVLSNRKLANVLSRVHEIKRSPTLDSHAYLLTKSTWPGYLRTV
jgi:hypothetical protein